MQHLKKISGRMLQVPDRLTEQIVDAAAKLRKANTEDTAKINQVLRRILHEVFVLAKRNDEMELAAFDISRRRRRQGRGMVQALPKSQIRRKRILPNRPTHSLFYEISRFSPLNDRELSLQLMRPLDSNFLALSVVNRFIRTEVMHYIEGHLSFDFTWDGRTLQGFCKHINPIHRR